MASIAELLDKLKDARKTVELTDACGKRVCSSEEHWNCPYGNENSEDCVDRLQEAYEDTVENLLQLTEALISGRAEDQDLVNALRCISSPGGPKGDCKKCPFYKTELVPEDLVNEVGVTDWSSCDVDAVGFAAADQIDNMNTHILALQKEIEKLRCQVPRWIPVTERLPVCDAQVLVTVSGKPKENITLDGAVELATLYSDGWCLETWPEWTDANVTYWMPLPKPPEVE
jgi:hypothetical protein